MSLVREASCARLLHVQYANPAAYPPLQHSSAILAEYGWEVLFLGTRTTGTEALELPPRERITVKLRSRRPIGWMQKLHYLGFHLWVLAWALLWRPDWVYVSDPLAAPAGWVLSRLLRIRSLYHEHDAPAQDSPVSPFMRWVLYARGELARTADLCVLPNEGRMHKFTAEVGRSNPAVSVWNCPRRIEATDEPSAHNTNEFWLYYHGNLGPELLPLTIIDALATTPAHVKLRIVGYETGEQTGYMTRILERARALKLDGRIEYRGAISRDRGLLNLAKECDVGLALMPIASDNWNMTAMVGASNKPFDYLACGLALLVSDVNDWRETFVAPGLGLACDPSDAEGIAESLRWFVDHRDRTREMGRRGRRKILSEWNYETQFEPALRFLRDHPPPCA